MKKKIITLILLVVFSTEGYCQDSLIINNQDIKLINIISLNNTSLHYYNYSNNPYSSTLITTSIAAGSVSAVQASVDPFYKNIVIHFKTIDNQSLRGRLIGLDTRGVKFISSQPDSQLKIVQTFDANAIHEIVIQKPHAVTISASLGAIIFGFAGYKTEDIVNGGARAEADMENFLNFATFNWGAQVVEPEIANRNQFKDTVIGAITGAVIGAAIGTLFKNKVNVNSKYTELSKALSGYKKKYPEWQKKVVVRNQ